MLSYGVSLLYCVLKYSTGFGRAVKPPIHIFEGENVCIHVMTPAQSCVLLASSQTRRISPGVVTAGLKTTLPGHPRVAIQMSGNYTRVGVNLVQRHLAVQVLAACDEPKFAVVHRSCNLISLSLILNLSTFQPSAFSSSAVSAGINGWDDGAEAS